MNYIVVSGEWYADGSRGWTRDRSKAFEFTDAHHRWGARKWAEEHATSLKEGNINGDKTRESINRCAVAVPA